MIKGCRKKMIIVSGLNDSAFEMAYFILKDEEKNINANDCDIIKKANSIIENATEKASKNHDKSIFSRRIRPIISFLVGFILGGSTFWIVSAVIKSFL